MSRYSDALRILRLVERIRGPGLTLAELRAEFCVSPATLRRDLAALRQAGFELIESRRGRHKVVQCNSATVKMGLETSVWVILTTLFDEVHGGVAEAHLGDLRRMATLRLGLTDSDLDQRFVREPSPREAPEISVALHEVLDAVLRSKVLRARYGPYGAGVFEFRIAPWSLFRRGDRLYVLGPNLDQAPDEFHAWRLDRFREVDVLRTSFERPADWDPGRVFRGRFGAFHDDRGPEWVTLAFAARDGETIRRTALPCYERRDSEGKGEVIVELLVHPDTAFERWLMRQGSAVEVREPAWLRQRMVDEYRKLIRRYGDATNQG
ncbi:MAG: WYL domain-containing transcriptional regulator [Myxococcota bacterium]